MKQQTATLTKVNRPILSSVFPRKRLFNALDRMKTHPGVWVSGPPGSGKTTLITSFLEDCGLPCLWYQVDEGDQDPATFFCYLGKAARQASPRKKKPLPLLTPEYLPGLTTFTLRYFEALFSRLPSPFALVFDNCQEVPEGSLFYEVIRQVLTTVPKEATVFLISRQAPPPELTRMMVHKQMAILDWQMLKLTREETAGIVHIQSDGKVPAKTVLRLHQASDGWIAGLVLMLDQTKAEGLDFEWMGRFTPEEIFDYFAGESFSRVDTQTQVFLLKTALLSKMTAHMAKELTGISNAGRILSQLNRGNFFTEKRFLSAPSYQYHPLFREFLLSRARHTFLEEDLLDLQRKAARILENAGEIEAVFSLLRDIKDLEGVARLIMTHAPVMLAQGRNRTLEQWVSALPQERVSESPWLLFWKGACAMPFDPQSSRTCFEQAFGWFKEQENAEGAFLSWSGIIDTIVFSMESFIQLDGLIEDLNGLIKKFNGLPPCHIEAHVASKVVAALSLRKPELSSEIESWAEKVMAAEEYPGIMDVKVQTMFHLAHHQLTVGEIKKASLSIARLKNLVKAKEVGPLSKIVSKMIEGMFSHMTGQHDKCIKSANDGLELSISTGAHVMDYMLLGQLAISNQDINDTESAEKYIDQFAQDRHKLRPWDSAYYHHLKYRQALIQREHHKSAHHAELALKLGEKVGSHFIHGINHVLFAKAMYELGEPIKANEYIQLAFHIGKQTKSKCIVFFALMNEAYFLLDQDKLEPGLKSLGKALRIGKAQQLLNTFIDRPEDTARLCEIALEHGIEKDYAQEIIRKRGLLPQDPTLHLENWPWPIKTYTLGRFSLVINEVPIKFSRKAQQKPLDLLKILIAYGGREVKEDQVADSMWPDADGDAAHQAYATTLHRLRKLIGNNEAIVRRNRCLTLDSRYIWVDAWAFEHLLGQAEAAWHSSTDGRNLDAAARLIQKAIDLYQGSFLNYEETEPWTISRRERLRSKFIRAVETLGKNWEEEGQVESAVEWYRKCLEKDDLSEAIFQRLMNCHIKLGHKADALRTYDRCRETLAASSGIEPSPQTEALRNKLGFVENSIGRSPLNILNS
ncbi:MAG: hypothetical protein KJP07_11415 [Desulfatitalea sp.]|nr:hypothetical protein [Desulfatitalea sp.]